MKRVLIFGGTGFLGCVLTAALEAAPEFLPILPERARWDIRDGASLDRILGGTEPDIVLNMAAISSTGVSPDKVYAVNAQGALNLLEALIRAGFNGRHIFFSSSNIYGAANGGPLHEDMRPLPLNHYSCAKLLAEHYCAMYAQEVQTTILRPFSVIGAGQKPYFLLPKLARHFADRLPAIELGNLDVAKDFVDARDFAAMMLCVLRAEAPPAMINLCNGETTSLNRLLEIFREASGHDPKITVNPDFIRLKDILYQRGDPGLIRSLGYTRRYPIAETVRWIYDSARNEGQTK